MEALSQKLVKTNLKNWNGNDFHTHHPAYENSLDASNHLSLPHIKCIVSCAASYKQIIK